MNGGTDNDREKLLESLVRCANQLFPSFGHQPVQVRWVNTSHRVFSTFYEFKLFSAHRDQTCLVKVTRSPHEMPSHFHQTLGQHSLETLLPKPDPYGLEFRSLKAIEDHFCRLGDRRFNWLCVRGPVLNDRGLIMDKIQGDTLSQVMRQKCFGRDSRGCLPTVFHTAGAWLYEFHQMDPPAHTQHMSTNLNDVQDEIVRLIEFIETHQSRNLSHVGDRLHRLISELDDGDLKHAVSHHDFSPRNIVVHANQSITVIDTLTEFCRPIYEDLAHFIVDCRLSKLQLLTHDYAFRPAKQRDLMSNFLAGYFQEHVIPWKWIQLYEARQLLIALAVGLWEQRQALDISLAQRFLWALKVRAADRLLEESLHRGESSARYALKRRRQPLLNRKQTLRNRRIEPITNCLTERVQNYFPELKSIDYQVTCRESAENKFSSISKFQVEYPGGQHHLIVKTAKNPSFRRTSSGPPQMVNDRPRLAPLIAPEDEIRLEAVALTRIKEHFDHLRNPQLKSIALYDWLESEPALVLAYVECPTLAQVVARSDYISLNHDRTLERVGQWLREFHSVPIAHARDRNISVRTFQLKVQEFTEFLSERLAWRAWLQDVDRRVSDSLSHCDGSEWWTAATNHGDFAPHNVFVGPRGEISAFDTAAMWRSPIFEDIAHFLCVMRDQVSRVNRSTLANFEQEFLFGYFGNGQIPRKAINLFRVLIWLDKWCSSVYSAGQASGLVKVAKSARLAFRNKRYRQRINELLGELEKSPATLAGSMSPSTTWEASTVACKS